MADFIDNLITITNEKKSKEKFDSFWAENHSNVCALAQFLVDEQILTTPQSVIDFFEKPYNWNKEWKEYADLY